MATSTAFSTILEAVLREMWSASSAEQPLKGTATGGSTITVAISGAAYASTSSNHYDGVGIYVLSTTDAAAPQGEYRRATTRGFASSTGTWTVGPAFSAVIGAGDVVLFLYGLSRESILDAAND